MISSKIKRIKANEVVVKNVLTGHNIPFEVVYDGKNNPEGIVFNTSMAFGTSKFFKITK